MPNRRVVITGIGVVSAIGRDVPTFWQSLRDGRSGIGQIEAVDVSQLRFRNGGEVRGFMAEDHFERRQLQYLDRFGQFALIATREAVAGSGLEWTPGLRARTGVVTGTGAGGLETQDSSFERLYGEGKGRVSPLAITRTMTNAATSQISMEYGLTGPSFTTSTACSSSNHAIGLAFWLVRNGVADACVTGGSEAPLTYGTLKAWEAMRVIDPDTCRPFSRDRKGLVLGEGAGILVIEELEMARARGASIYAEIVGFGMTADAHHITQPSPEGAAQAIKLALADAGLQPEEIGYVNAHGTATPTNDSMETQAIRLALGKQAERVAVSSTKSMHGHALGGSGALEAVAVALALKHGVLPPTANYREFDPECDLDVVPNQAREARVEYAISNSFAFGGLNAVLAFRRWEA